MSSIVLLICRLSLVLYSVNIVCNELIDGVRYVGVYEFDNEFMYIHSVKWLLMSTTRVIVRADGCFWLKCLAIRLFMLCNTISAEWFLSESCCVVMCRRLLL